MLIDNKKLVDTTADARVRLYDECSHRSRTDGLFADQKTLGARHSIGTCTCTCEKEQEQNADCNIQTIFCFSTTADTTDLLYVVDSRRNNNSKSPLKAKSKVYFCIFCSKFISKFEHQIPRECTT